MANSAVTLSSGVVSTITVDGDHDEIEVIQLSGTPVAVYYTIGTDASTTPNPVAGTIGAGQGGSFVLPAVLGASRVHSRPAAEPRTVVKIVAAGTPVVGVQPLGAKAPTE
mgnify:FL=1